MKGEQVLVKTRTNLNYKRNKECPVLLPKISESNEHLERKEGRREWGREGGRGRESFEGKKYKATSFKEVNRYFQLWNNLIEFLNRKKKGEEIWAEITENKDQKWKRFMKTGWKQWMMKSLRKNQTSNSSPLGVREKRWWWGALETR